MYDIPVLREVITDRAIVAMAALRQKKAHEDELDKIAGTRLTLETQVSSASFL